MLSRTLASKSPSGTLHTKTSFLADQLLELHAEEIFHGFEIVSSPTAVLIIVFVSSSFWFPINGFLFAFAKVKMVVIELVNRHGNFRAFVCASYRSLPKCSPLVRVESRVRIQMAVIFKPLDDPKHFDQSCLENEVCVMHFQRFQDGDVLFSSMISLFADVVFGKGSAFFLVFVVPR